MKWILENWKLITTIMSIISAVIGWIAKHRAELWNKAKVTISEAIEKAELLQGATGEQKKEFAMALCGRLNFAIKKISNEMERQLLLTKNVNVKSYKTGEVLY